MGSMAIPERSPGSAPWLAGEASPILIALCGQSPAVITETVWALAHETPPVLPARVIAVTTREGRDSIRRELLHSGVWQRLRRALQVGDDRLLFGDSADAVRTIPNRSRDAELTDIRDGDDTLAVADFLLETLRQFTEDPTVRIVLSIAGGRKTMSVAAALALTLLGRACDRMCHVLAAPPFDRPDLEPRFYFPDPAIPEYAWTGPEGERRAYTPEQARIVLADIPYVRVRRLLSARYGPVAPAGYREMVAAALAGAETLAPAVTLEFAPAESRLAVAGVELAFSPSRYGLLLFLGARARLGKPPLLSAKTLQAELLTFLERLEKTGRFAFAGEAKRRIASAAEPDYVRKLVHAVEQRLAALDLPGPMRRRLTLRVPDRTGLYGLSLRPEEINIPGGVADLVRDGP